MAGAAGRHVMMMAVATTRSLPDMNPDPVAQRYQALLERITAQEKACQRTAGSVGLLAVSKTHGPEKIAAAYRAGARQFGENYVQEALDKIGLLAAPPYSLTDISWHFIGPIQSNKTRDIAAAFDWVHAVDRLKIAQRLHDQRPDNLPPLNVCIQVNLSGEESKSGISLGEVAPLCEAIRPMDRLRLRGLMAIPAPCHDYAQQRATFHPLAELFHQLGRSYPDMDTLSIGMSDDFEAAIAEGSTLIRIGTAIFGAR
jgi:PLP dependent protein